jgi:hypothetical protein
MILQFVSILIHTQMKYLPALNDRNLLYTESQPNEECKLNVMNNIRNMILQFASILIQIQMSLNRPQNLGNMIVQAPQQSEGYKLIPIDMLQSTRPQFDSIESLARKISSRVDVADLTAKSGITFAEKES